MSLIRNIKFKVLLAWTVFGIFVLSYLVAKVHTYTNLKPPFSNFVQEHWPYWAGILLSGVLAVLVGRWAEKSAGNEANQ